MAQALYDRISKRLNNIYKYVAVYSLGKLFGGDERFALLRESERNKSRKEVVATVTNIVSADPRNGVCTKTRGEVE